MSIAEIPFDSRIFEPRRKKSRPSYDPYGRSYRSNRGVTPPGRNRGFGIRRRNLLLVAGAVVVTGSLGVVAAAVLEGQESHPNPYSGWEKYKNGELPQETVVAIGQDLAGNHEYPGFAEVGEIILKSQLNPDQLQAYSPVFKDRIPVVFSNIMQTDGSLSAIENAYDTLNPAPVALRNKQSLAVTRGFLVYTDRMRLKVIMDNGSHDAPEIAKKLLLVKEFCHLLYIQQHANVLAQELLGNYDLALPQPIPDLHTSIFISANYKYQAKSPEIPEIGDYFKNALTDIDGAGYWHVLPAFGKMKRGGVFTNKHLSQLWTFNQPFEKAFAQGFLIEKTKGEFVWKDGVTPFSPEWTRIMRPVLQS